MHIQKSPKFLQHFPEFIDQQLKIWADNRQPADNNRKETLELSSPSIKLIGDKYYWIAGAEEVHLLNHKRSIGDKTKSTYKKPECISVCLCVLEKISSEARSYASEASKPPAGARISKGPKGPEILVG